MRYTVRGWCPRQNRFRVVWNITPERLSKAIKWMQERYIQAEVWQVGDTRQSKLVWFE